VAPVGVPVRAPPGPRRVNIEAPAHRDRDFTVKWSNGFTFYFMYTWHLHFVEEISCSYPHPGSWCTLVSSSHPERDACVRAVLCVRPVRGVMGWHNARVNLFQSEGLTLNVCPGCSYPLGGACAQLGLGLAAHELNKNKSR
jgi:hypothetical protein